MYHVFVKFDDKILMRTFNTLSQCEDYLDMVYANCKPNQSWIKTTAA